MNINSSRKIMMKLLSNIRINSNNKNTNINTKTCS